MAIDKNGDGNVFLLVKVKNNKLDLIADQAWINGYKLNGTITFYHNLGHLF